MIWKEVVNKIANGEDPIPSPFAKGAYIEHYYVQVDEVKKRGFFMAWCPVSLKGIQVTSVVVDSNVSFITLEEFKEKVKVPPIVKWMDPTK